MARGIARWGGILVLISIGAIAARAADYPTRPITAVVPFAAGGPTDIVARAFGQKMGTVLGQPIVIENRGGAGGRVGGEAGARAAADGYTITVINTATHGIIPVTVRSLAYDPVKSFEMIGLIGTYPLVLVCNPKLPVNNIREMIAYLRKGGKLSYASPGAGGQGHFAGEFFKARAGVQMLHVPYRGTGPALQDVIAGVVDCVFDGTSKPHIDAGRVRAFALTSAARSAMYPGVPTMDESGLKGLDMTTWIGLAAPAGTPPEAVRKLTQALRAALKDEGLAAAVLRTGTTVVSDTSPQDLRQRIEHDLAMYRQIAEEAGIEPQ